MAETLRLWTVALDLPASAVAALGKTLDLRETAAAEQRKEPHRSRYIVAHGATRVILGNLLGAEPETVQFDRTCEHCGNPDHGRPRLAHRPDVQYSLSHSQGLAVVATVPGPVRIGVDVEVVAPRRSNLARLAARVMHDRELEQWRTVPATDQLRAFLAVWTAKEAYLKGVGLGLVRDPRAIAPDPPGWTFVGLDLAGEGVDAVGTLAVESREAEEPRIERWSPPVP